MKIEQSKIDRYLKKVRAQPCQLCGKTDWIIYDRVFQMTEYFGSSSTWKSLSKTCPVVPITCSSCGNTLLVNAVAAGFIDAESEKEEEADE